jgi:acetyltransferase-like isoleucine patch superfamily enzyme
MPLPGIAGLREDEVTRLKDLGAVRKFRVEAPRLSRGLVLGRMAKHHELLRAERGARLIGTGEMSFGRFVLLGVDSCIGVYRGATLTVGERTSIGDRTVVNVSDSMTIGAHCNIAPDCNLSDGDFHDILDENGNPVGPRNKPVVIGDHVWIAVGVIVLKGVTIGSGSVLGAGSVVTRDIPAGVVAVGNPARVLKKIAGWR